MEHIILVLDFDDTIFQSKIFKKDLFDGIAEHLGVSLDVVQQTYDEIKKDGYAIEPHVALIKKSSPDAQEEKLTPFLANLFSSLEKYLFDDVLSVLESLKQKGVVMILLTYGAHDFQSQKVSGAGVVKFFEKIVITTDAKSAAVKELFRDTHRMVAVDNTIEHLDDIKKEISAVETIAINRYGELQAVEAMSHHVIKDLHELESYLFS